jgi:hypothetical protein
MLVLASSRIAAAQAPPPPPTPARDHRLEFAAIGGVAGGVYGAIAWHATGPHWRSDDTAGRASVIGTILGAGIGLFVASFSLPPSTADARRTHATAASVALGSHVAIQPVISRDRSAAIVRLRF